MTAASHDQWGPNGLAVEQIVRTAERLSTDELRRLASAWGAWTAIDPAESPVDEEETPWLLASDPWNDAEEALDAAAAATGRNREVNAAWSAARRAVLASTPGRNIAGDGPHRAANAAAAAATAAAAADLVETGGLTVAHAWLLTRPWHTVFGDLGEPVCECEEETP